VVLAEAIAHRKGAGNAEDSDKNITQKADTQAFCFAASSRTQNVILKL
jgi:hypothetical protein